MYVGSACLAREGWEAGTSHQALKHIDDLRIAMQSCLRLPNLQANLPKGQGPVNSADDLSKWTVPKQPCSQVPDI